MRRAATRNKPVIDLSQFPLRLLPEHLMVIFDILPARFYELNRAGRFEKFELKPKIGRQAYSRALVQAYLDGQNLLLNKKPA